MNTASLLQRKHIDWKGPYTAAMLETNRSVVLQRISDAEKALLAREREIFYSHGTPEEEEAIEDALYALRAYKIAWQHSEAA